MTRASGMKRLLAVTGAVMVAVHLGGHVAGLPMLVLSPAGAAVLLVAARKAGLTWKDLGLARADLPRGARYAAPWMATAAAVYVGGLAIPATRGAFLDERYRGGFLVAALVVVPVSTVLFEEVAFRSVLWGAARELWDERWATLLSAGLFGLWHVLPALSMATSNPVAAKGAPAVTVVTTVAVTGVAGYVFCELRRRSGSLAAPALVHWAINGLGILAAGVAWRVLGA